MTQEEMDATAASALLEYSKTQQRIACLRKRIEPFSSGFSDLGQVLAYRAESVQTIGIEKGFRFRWREETVRPMPSAPAKEVEFDPAELVQHLQDLQRETKQLNELKRSLEQMGHGHALKD